MLLPQTRKVLSSLRRQSRLVRRNNQKVSDWVDTYINDCAIRGEIVTLVSQWCISKDLEKRYKKQDGVLEPTKKERKLFELEIPQILYLFTSNGFRVNWWVSFNRSCLDSGRVEKKIEGAYKRMILFLAKKLTQSGLVGFLDWEDDVINKCPEPNKAVLENIGRFVNQDAFALELDRHSRWAREEAGLKQTDEEILRDVSYQIACEAEEGKLLDSENSPFGNFILIPLELPERYDFFTLLAKGFKKRIVPILKPYPWRLKD